MGFVKERANINDKRQAEDWKYIQSLGIKNIWGELIGPDFCNLVVDREKKIYLIPLGDTNPNRDNVKIGYYALCINDKVINMEVDDQRRGSGIDRTFECHWIINKIQFPKGWSFRNVDEKKLQDIICEAFVASTYGKSLTSENVKSLTVEIREPFENISEIGENDNERYK